MLIGYARVSAPDQNLDRQIDQLTKMGCERIYYEKITGTQKDRPELENLLDNTHKDDVIVITDFTRLSRSTKDLLSIVETLEGKGAHIKSLK